MSAQQHNAMAHLQAETEEDVMASINVVPLVDVMLVMLIIFLIAVPIVIHTVPIDLPDESSTPTETRPENITIAVDIDGNIYWNERRVPDMATLYERMRALAAMDPQPEVHIRGDQHTRYHNIGRVVQACQRAGIQRVGFITEPEAAG